MKRKELVWQGFGILTLLFCFFYLTRSVIFSVEEEYGLYYIVQKGDFFLWLNDIAHETGRITFYVLCWFWAGPMFLGPVAYKICLCIFVGLDLLVFFRLLYVHVNRQFAFFCTALLIPLLQINDQHNLLITYAYLHVPFILILLSIHFLLDYGKGKKGYSAVLWSALCNFVASFFQENFVLFYVSCFLILFFHEKEKHFFKRCLHALWELRFHVLGGIVFLAAYFLFRASCAGSSYSGNTANFSWYHFLSLKKRPTRLKFVGIYRLEECGYHSDQHHLRMLLALQDASFFHANSFGLSLYYQRCFGLSASFVFTAVSGLGDSWGYLCLCTKFLCVYFSQCSPDFTIGVSLFPCQKKASTVFHRYLCSPLCHLQYIGSSVQSILYLDLSRTL